MLSIELIGVLSAALGLLCYAMVKTQAQTGKVRLSINTSRATRA
jgi:hypothetical protein